MIKRFFLYLNTTIFLYMKKIYLLVLSLLITQQVYSQKQDYQHIEMKGLAEKEMKSFTQKMGIGSVNPNTLNYDLQYQRMDIDIDPAVYYISGSVTSHFKPNQNLGSIYFDLTNLLTVSQVQYHGSNLPFQQLSTQEIKIDFPTSLSANVLDSLTIHYSGAPANNTVKIGTQGPNIPVFSTLNEPYGAQDWFPTKQSLNDKIEKFDFKITTPSQYSVAANGKLMSEIISATTGKKLTFWRTMYPTTAYLVALSITNFAKMNSTIGNPPFPFVNYIYPSTAGDPVKISNIEWTKQVMDIFETYLGPYPFRNEKYGHMEYLNGGGMEHQTMSSMSGWTKSLIAHELAHQWFGDKVTCGAWNDIWLNEGFATFGEHIANEKLIMTHDEFMNYLVNQTDLITNTVDGAIYVPDSGLNNIYRIFDSRLSYAKGGYALRMIKWILGDDVFYQALKDYHGRPALAYNYVRTADFNSSLLQSTGKDFTEFFKDWIYGEGYPTYMIKWKQAGNQIGFVVSQTQSSPTVSFFEMPLPVKVNGTGGQTAYLVLNNTSNNQYFAENISFPIASVEFNYEHQILENNSIVVQDNTLHVSSAEMEGFDLYPNPAKNELYLKRIDKPTEFSIHAIDGKLVRKAIYQPGKAIQIGELIPGAYVITVNGKYIKFIKD